LSATYKPSAEFSKKARIGSMAAYEKLYKSSIEKPEKFWGSEAKELHWQKPFTKVLEWKCPDAKWFTGGKINVAENCVDRHAKGPRANKAAIIFEGEPGDTRTITYAQLHREVCQFANVLLKRGVKAKDRVLIYMPMIPEAAVAMLACARIGAVHSVVFGGFASEAIIDRLEDSGATAIITADGGWRRGKVIPLKPAVDEALKNNSKVKKRFRRQSYRKRNFDETKTRLVVARGNGGRIRETRAKRIRFRAPAFHPLHLRLHR